MKLYSACRKLRIYRRLGPKYCVRRGESVHSYANEYNSKEVRKVLRILQIPYSDALLRYILKLFDDILKFTFTIIFLRIFLHVKAYYIKIKRVFVPYLERLYLSLFGPGSSVGIATDYGLDGPGSNPGGDEIFRPSRPALGPTQPPVQ